MSNDQTLAVTRTSKAITPVVIKPVVSVVKAAHSEQVSKALTLIGYSYSIGLFLFACALALSHQGVAFKPLHGQFKKYIVSESVVQTSFSKGPSISR